MDGVRLEGRLVLPRTPRGVAVLCHAPDPADGRMPNVLMPSLQRALETAGWAALRFNYRGVGQSQGTVAHPPNNTLDVLAAISFARERIPGVPCAVVGWSTGSLIALEACAGETGVEMFIGLSPPVSGDDHDGSPPASRFAGWGARTLLIAGTDDPACDIDQIRGLAHTLHADVELLEGAGHGFGGRLADLGGLITWFLR